MPYRPRHYLASITGKIISMSIAVGPVTRLMTRSLYTLIDSRNSWCQLLMISADARKELQFWLEWIGDLNGQHIWHSPSAIRVVYSDAGMGAIAHGQRLEHKRVQSLTWREMRAVHRVLKSLAEKLADQRIC